MAKRNWKKGMTDKKVADWTAWAEDYKSRDENAAKKSVGALCLLWLAGGPGMNERKLAKALRPKEAPKEKAAAEEAVTS